MFKYLIVSLLIVSTGCATVNSLNGAAANVVGEAIKDSERLHCGAVGAPPKPVCLSDNQFKAVNVDFVKISAAGLAYTNSVKAAQLAKTQPTAQAISTVIQAFIDGIKDVEQVLGSSTTADKLVADLQSALKVL